MQLQSSIADKLITNQYETHVHIYNLGYERSYWILELLMNVAGAKNTSHQPINIVGFHQLGLELSFMMGYTGKSE